MQETTEQTKYTEETLFDALVAKYNLIYDIELDVKDILDGAKEQKVIEDISLINSIAKAKARNKVGDLEEKAKKQLAKIEELLG